VEIIFTVEEGLLVRIPGEAGLVLFRRVGELTLPEVKAMVLGSDEAPDSYESRDSGI